MNPAVARIITTEHMTASTSKPLLAIDAARYGYNKSRRLLKKVGQRSLKRTFFAPPGRDRDWEERVALLPEVSELFDGLKEHNIIPDNLSPTVVPTSLLGRFMTVGQVVAHLR